MSSRRALRRNAVTPLAVALSLALVATLLDAQPSAGDTTIGPLLQQERSVAGRNGTVRPRAEDPAAKATLREAPPVRWPAAGVTEVAAAKALAPIGDLPIRVGLPSGETQQARVEVLSRSAAERSGVRGLLLRVGWATGQAPSGKARLEVDYSGFRDAYGADWAARLRMVRLPSCALTAPERPQCRTQTAVPSTNDVVSGHLTATVDVPATSTAIAEASQTAGIYAVLAGPSGASGDYTATSLSPSATWQAGGSGGDFSWSYPFRVPPVPGGLAPELGLSYSSGSIDGRTASTNNQPSWVGEGFTMWPGYVERQFKACADDMSGGNNTRKTGDLCWATNNAKLVLGGRATELVRDDATGAWHGQLDDGSRVELLLGAANGDNAGEHWRLTTTDGTQFYFGRHRLPGWVSGKPVTESTWTVPVFGNHAGEPCHASSFADSWCQQAWRWNLDYVVDPHGNAISYFYGVERNYYARDLTASQATQYERGGYLVRAEYGERDGAVYAGSAPARTVFTVANRCIPGTTCTSSQPANWPDTPWDQNCGGGSCSGKWSPTFWTQKRLSKITTQVWNGSAYRNVDSWTLTHTFPDPGDATSAALWLEKIQHTGHVGGTVSLPPVNFDGVALQNRVDGLEGLPPIDRYRVDAINNETGGVISVTYSSQECAATSLPTPDQNGKRCFPIYWTPEGASEPIRDWFHKYVVDEVAEIDGTTDAPTVRTTYEYVGAPAWHYDDNELAPSNRRTWSQWRGYSRVRTRRGATGGLRSLSETLYFRGMDGDRLSGGGTRNVTVTDSEGVAVEDHWRLQGYAREEVLHNGSGGLVVSGTINDPWLHGPTASRARSGLPALTALMLQTAKARTRTALSSGGWRRTEVGHSFDGHGRTTQTNDRGDLASTTDNQCSRFTYASNTSKWMLNYLARQETVAVRCDQTPTRPDDVLADVRSYYDGSTTVGAAPTRGDVTKVEELSDWSSGPQYTTVTRATYDQFGRVLDSFDPLGAKTTTAYTQTAGLTTQVKVTNPLGHVSTTNLEPAWGLAVAEVDPNAKRTDLAYDALGRLTDVWLPGRSRSAGETPHTKFTYRVGTDAPVAVETRTLQPFQGEIRSWSLFDGLLRPRQTQTEAVGGIGRVITDTIYDSRGLVVTKNGPYYNDQGIGRLLFLPTTAVPAQTLHVYDGAERQTAEIFRSDDIERWRTTTTYGGDRVSVDPPAGGIATTKIVDGRGQVTELRQYHGGSPSGEFDATAYTYTRGGELSTVTDPAGNVWRYFYDLRGRRIRAEDPDAGVTTSTYDDADQLTSTTDARGITLAYAYDVLGRKTSTHQGSLSGTALAEWTYDTLAKGMPVSSTAYQDGHAYSSAVSGYDDGYRPTGSTVTIPATEGALAGTYEFGMTYNVTGGLEALSMPAAGGLPAETVHYGYNEHSLPVRMWGSNEYVGGTVYTPFAELHQIKFYDGSFGHPEVLLTNQRETGTHRLSGVKVVRPGATNELLDLKFAYDPAGNITKIADQPFGGVEETQCFGRDWQRRLTEAWTPASGDCASGPSLGVLGGPAPYWHSYSYDVTGNRLSETRHATAGDTTSTFTYPAAGGPQPHAVQQVTTQSPSGSELSTFDYDPAGNTTSRQQPGSSQTLTWDPRGRVASVTDASQTTSFVYDASGNRLIRRDPQGSTLYLGQMELHADPGGQVRARRYYTFAGQPVAVRTPQGLWWLAGDQHGSGQLAIDAGTANVTGQRRFFPFGEPRSTAGAWPDERGFVGGTMDASTGLTHLGAREYDPALGRFISPDPVLDHTTPQQVNPYAYANNDPISLADPSGLFCNERDSGAMDPRCPHDNRTFHNDTHRNDTGARWTPEAASRLQRSRAARQRTYTREEAIARRVTIDGPLGAIVPPMDRTPRDCYMNSVQGVSVCQVIDSAVAFTQATEPYLMALLELTDANTLVACEEGNDRACISFAVAATAGKVKLPKKAYEAYKTWKKLRKLQKAAKSGTELRRVGDALESIDDVYANPQLLAGRHPAEVENILKDTPGWQVEKLGRGSQAGRGWVFRQYTESGNPTGLQLRWHPGGGHHGPEPYWRVVGPNGDLGGIIR